MLTRNPEHHSAGSQQLHVWTRIEEIGEGRGGWQHLFKIVKHQQIVAISQHGPEHVQGRTAIWPHPESGGNGGQHERRLLHVPKIHELGGVGS
jgi:hypothetical protein